MTRRDPAVRSPSHATAALNREYGCESRATRARPGIKLGPVGAHPSAVAERVHYSNAGWLSSEKTLHTMILRDSWPDCAQLHTTRLPSARITVAPLSRVYLRVFAFLSPAAPLGPAKQPSPKHSSEGACDTRYRLRPLPSGEQRLRAVVAHDRVVFGETVSRRAAQHRAAGRARRGARGELHHRSQPAAPRP
jgi:hypothetical protein